MGLPFWGLTSSQKKKKKEKKKKKKKRERLVNTYFVNMYADNYLQERRENIGNIFINKRG